MYAFSLPTSSEETLSYPALSQLFQMLFKKIGAGGLCSDPGPMEQEIMDLIRENKLLHTDFLFAQSLSQLNCLRKLHISVIISLNEEHRRTPGADRRQRR